VFPERQDYGLAMVREHAPGSRLIDALQELRRLDAAAHLAARGSPERERSDRQIDAQRREVRRLAEQGRSSG
jgi:aminoglycoside phosphotransferase (APT) family kinase protein